MCPPSSLPSQVLIAAAWIPPDHGPRWVEGRATSGAAVVRAGETTGRRGGGLTRIETAVHVLSATEAIGDGAHTRDRRQHTMMTDVRETNHAWVLVRVRRVECGAGISGTVGQWDDEAKWCFGTE
jgi:hypothetical protein